MELNNGVLYDEPVDRLRLRVAIQPDSVQVTQLEATAGSSQIALTGIFDHPRGVFDQGTVAFQVKTGKLDLARIRNVQTLRPGLSGALDVSGEGKGVLRDAGP